MSGERERVTRLETRAREAENALQQLRGYIELLKKKSAEPNTGAFVEEARQLERENTQLKAEVEELRKKLVTVEIRNGVPQIPQPTSTPPTTQLSSTATPPKVDAPSAAPSANGGAAGTETNSKKKEKSKAKADKKGKADENSGKKKGGGPELPVDVSRLDLRIGKIIRAWKHPDADSLYVEEVDVGEEKSRNVCSGLVQHIPLEEMQDRLAMFMCNLKPAKMRGVPSEAMVMCASTPEKVEILAPPTGCVPGDRVSCDGYPGEPDAQLNPKKKVWENIQPDLRTNDEGMACYKGTPLTVAGKGVFRAATLRGTPINYTDGVSLHTGDDSSCVRRTVFDTGTSNPCTAGEFAELFQSLFAQENV